MSPSKVVPSVTQVSLPNLDFRGYARDPVGTAISNLQNALQFGVSEYNKAKAITDAENQEVVENFYKAHELAGEEMRQEELAAKFKATYGKDIDAYTNSHVRLTNEGNGRIRGRNWVNQMEQDIAEGKIATVVDFNKAWDKSVQELDTEFPDNDAMKVGWLERTAEVRDELTSRVFDQDLANRRKQSFEMSAQEVSGEFDVWRTSDGDSMDDDAFVERMRGVKLRMQEKFKNGQDEDWEAPFVDSLVTASITPAMADDAVEFGEMLIREGLVTSASGKEKVQRAINTAVEQGQNFNNAPDIATQKELYDMMTDWSVKYTLNGKSDDKILKEVIRKGGPWGAALADKVKDDVQGALDPDTSAASGTLPVDVRADFVAFQEAKLNNDPSQVREIISKPGWLAATAAKKGGKELIEDIQRYLEDAGGEGSRFYGILKERVEEVGADKGWGPNDVRAALRAIQLRADENPFENISEALKYMDETLERTSKKFELDLSKDTPFIRPKNWVEAERNVVIYSAREKIQKEEFERLRDELARVFVGVPGTGVETFPTDQEREVSLQAQADMQAAYRELLETQENLKRSKELRRLRRAQAGPAGMTLQQQEYHNIYVGDPNAELLVESERNQPIN